MTFQGIQDIDLHHRISSLQPQRTKYVNICGFLLWFLKKEIGNPINNIQQSVLMIDLFFILDCFS